MYLKNLIKKRRRTRSWENIDPDPVTKESRMIPAVYLSFWHIQEGAMPGVGKMMGFTYTLYDNTFEANWKIVS